MCWFLFCFFFFKQKTAYEMRISDWSSDVCSSDLLVRDGFRGRIYATAATRDVAALILKDSGYLNEKDADFLNRIGATRHKPALPLYGVRDAERAIESFSSVQFSKSTELPGGARVTFRLAGHILGAATADVEWAGRRIVF